MKIINDTNATLEYLVTPSGTTLSGSKVIASGRIWANTAREFDVDPGAAGTGPNVYVQPSTQGAGAYVYRQAANASSVLRVRMDEE
jgi:hypothetical protein